VCTALIYSAHLEQALGEAEQLRGRNVEILHHGLHAMHLIGDALSLLPSHIPTRQLRAYLLRRKTGAGGADWKRDADARSDIESKG
jgi:hypothetical protein